MSSLKLLIGSTLLCLIALFLIAGLSGSDFSDKATSSLSNPEEAINRTIQMMYQSFSFEEGDRPDYQTLQEIFTGNGRIIYLRNDSLRNRTIDKYIAFHKKLVDGMSYLDEFEIKGETHYYENIAH